VEESGSKKSGLEDERGGDDQQYSGELETQAAVLGLDALQGQSRVARQTKSSTDQRVQRDDHQDRNDGDQTAVDGVHDEVRKLVVLSTTADLQTTHKAVIHEIAVGHDKMRSGAHLRGRLPLVSFNHVTDPHFVTFLQRE